MVIFNTMWKIYPLNENVDKIHKKIMFFGIKEPNFWNDPRKLWERTDFR